MSILADPKPAKPARPPKPMRNEKDVKARVKALLEKHGWFWWMPPANGFGASGISDFNAIKDGVFLAVETKFGTNKPTAMQKGYLESINAAHGFGFVVNDSNIDQLEAFLEHFSVETLRVANEGKMSNTAGAAILDAIRALHELI